MRNTRGNDALAARGVWLLAGLLSLLAAQALAQAPSAEEILTSKGLRKLNTSFVVPDETELSKSLHQAEAARRDLVDAQKELGQRKKVVEDKRQLLVNYMEQRRQLREQLLNARSVEAHNRVVAALNEVGDRVVLLVESKQEEQAQQAATARVSQLTEQYLDQLLKARATHDRVAARYGELAVDPDVQHALQEYNQTSPRTHTLGPTATFQSNGRRLAKLEEAVQSDSIELRHGRGGLWHLTAVFNGSHALEMAIDTGASMIVLPRKVAEEAGLRPSEDAPKIQLHVADGRVVEGRLVVADKVRVGRFTVEKVECAVMPSEMGETVPLLGLSFFKHFTFKLDTTAGKLNLSHVDSVEPARPAPNR